MSAGPTGTHSTHTFHSRSFLGVSAPYSESQLWELRGEYNASPRVVAIYVGSPTGYGREVARLVQSVSSASLVQTLKSTYPDDLYDPIVVMEPSPTSRIDWAKLALSKRAIGIFLDQKFITTGYSALGLAGWYPRGWNLSKMPLPDSRAPMSDKAQQVRERNDVIDISWSCNKSGGG